MMTIAGTATPLRGTTPHITMIITRNGREILTGKAILRERDLIHHTAMARTTGIGITTGKTAGRH